MEVKKNRAANTTITRDTAQFSKGTDNIYETVALLSKRANQIASDMKRELHKKIEEFSSNIDTMDEIYENREQIEVVRHYEQMPKPTLMATGIPQRRTLLPQSRQGRPEHAAPGGFGERNHRRNHRREAVSHGRNV